MSSIVSRLVIPASVVGLVLLSLSNSLGAVQMRSLPSRGAAPPARKSPADARREQILLDLPPTTQRLLVVMGRLSTVRRVSVGIEVVMPPETPRDPTGQGMDDYQDNLTSRSVTEALDRITKYKIQGVDATYEWSSDRGVYHVRPQRFRNNRDVALNRALPRVDETFANVNDALHQVVRFFVPSFPAHASAPRTPPPAVRAFMEKPVRVSMSGPTVREVLDEIVRQLDGASWVARYAAPNGSAAGLSIEIFTFENRHVIVHVPLS